MQGCCGEFDSRMIQLQFDVTLTTEVNMSKSNEEKSSQLGMPHGTARNKMVKGLLFSLMQKCGMDKCHQCGEVISSVDDLSIEHKTPWLHSEDPVRLFFDPDNVAFSHLSCNCSASRGYTGKITSPCPSAAAYNRGCRCQGCRDAHTKRNLADRRKRRGTGLERTNRQGTSYRGTESTSKERRREETVRP